MIDAGDSEVVQESLFKDSIGIGIAKRFKDPALKIKSKFITFSSCCQDSRVDCLSWGEESDTHYSTERNLHGVSYFVLRLLKTFML